MKIALFTDTYRPSTNGIVFVIDILHDNLRTLGHDLTIVAPRPGLRAKHTPKVSGKNIIWIPAAAGLTAGEHLISVYSNTFTMRKLCAQKFDVVIFFTPGQIGLLGANVAKRCHIPLIEQYCTDMLEYSRTYRAILFAGLVLTPRVVSIIGFKNTATMFKRFVYPDFYYKLPWYRQAFATELTSLHNSCDSIVCVSLKNLKQLKESGVTSRALYIPTGINKLPVPKGARNIFRQKYKIGSDDSVILFVGRLGAEKNLDMLIDAFKIVAGEYLKAKLLFVGDFDYRQHLEAKVKVYNLQKRVVFTGRLPRSSIGSAYAASDIFAFPSLTDTQGIVLNEAAHAGLPIVWCDKDVNQVAVDKYNAILAGNNPQQFAAAIIKLLANKTLRAQYAKNSIKLARRYSEQKMILKLIEAIGTTKSKG